MSGIQLRHVFFILILQLFTPSLVHGQGICTEVIYGEAENHYMPVEERYCCVGYRETGSGKCLPACDLGCPSHSHCAYPNHCECNWGYDAAETIPYFGTQAIKSCKLSAGSVTAICILLIVVITFAGLIFVMFWRLSTVKDVEECNWEERHSMTTKQTDD